MEESTMETTTIASLPVEITAQILQSLPCFHDVHSAILSSRLFHNAWLVWQSSIIASIARKNIRQWEPLVTLELARKKKFEVSADEVANYRLTVPTLKRFYQQLDEAAEKYTQLNAKHLLGGPTRFTHLLPPQPHPRPHCALELRLFTRIYLTMKLIEAHPAKLKKITPLLKRITTIDLLRICQMQKNIYHDVDAEHKDGGKRGGWAYRAFLRRLPRGSFVWEALMERMVDGAPFALWREGQVQVRAIQQAMKRSRVPYDPGPASTMEDPWADEYARTEKPLVRGAVMGFYRYN
ncbi:hypothetical protein L873DRAFT_1714853 [Choiromyces venosus 120613-1]|uniref:F-box domain-containing protein n=1 Tax=Choiromyces venosus 120613-1 TaxID=1336337 RepID=A0A3N4J211_9PEZI|nr:hypothetical protein L873DRAFT_1714853 [Choiromyces venosus 120613-1]